jgi:hypothetical protein
MRGKATVGRAVEYCGSKAEARLPMSVGAPPGASPTYHGSGDAVLARNVYVTMIVVVMVFSAMSI